MPDVSEAIAAASAAAEKEFAATNEPAADTAPDTTPEAPAAAPAPTAKASKAEPAAPAAAEAAPAEDNPLDLTKDDLKAIEEDPLLRKAYKTVLRGFTAKTTGLAAERKKFEEDLKVLEWFRADPDNALREIAKLRGLDLGPGQQPKTEAQRTVDEVEDVMLKAFGPDGTKALRPVFEAVVQKLVDSRIRPQAEELARIKDAALEQGVESVVQTFAAEKVQNEEDYDQSIQDEMAEMAQRVRKADSVPLKDHLQTLYDAVMHRRAQKGKVSTELKRLQEARKKTEPVQGTRPAAAPERKISADMPLNEKVALAVEMARAGR